METSGFPLFGVPLAGSRPGRRPTFLRRQESRQRSDPCFTGLLIKRCLIKRLPCAAHIGRPAQNSPAGRAQTAAPEGPARCCAARRLRRGFAESPSVAGRACVIDEKAGSEGVGKVGSVLARRAPRAFSIKARGAVQSPFRTAEQQAGKSLERDLGASSSHANFVFIEPVFKVAHAVRTLKTKLVEVGARTHDHFHRCASKINRYLRVSVGLEVLGCIARAVFSISEVRPFQFLVVKVVVSESAYLVCPL